MTDQLERDIKRGQRASELLNNEIFEEAWAALRASYLDAWVASASGETELREKLHVAIGVLAGVRACIEEIINTGSIAAANLNWLLEERKAEQLMTAANKGF